MVNGPSVNKGGVVVALQLHLLTLQEADTKCSSGNIGFREVAYPEYML